MSTTARGKTINDHLVFALGGDDHGRVNDAQSNNVVDYGEVDRQPGNTTTKLQTPTGYVGIHANRNVR